MRTMPDSSVDSIVTDPPYGIRFMGKAWDGADIEKRAERRRGYDSHAPGCGPNGGHKSLAVEAGKYDLAPSAMQAFQEFSEEWARQALRVLKPGGHLLSFASARTYHRMASGIEDAGFEIRDQIMWVYGSGFPKSHNGIWGGTALKPAHEPIVVARKPLDGTVAENFAAHGTGALNIDACRVETHEPLRVGAGTTWDKMHEHEGREGEPSADRRHAEKGGTNFTMTPGPRGGDAKGRWPANLIHDGSQDVLDAFPHTESGVPSGVNAGNNNNVFGQFAGGIPVTGYGDAGSSSRFFYCAKATKSDRDEGLGEFSLKEAGIKNESGRGFSETDPHRKIMRANNHPTVKPTDLMRYLCRLITPAGGMVLDPFMGSGSTGKAAALEGLGFTGIEMQPEYFEIAKARIKHAQAERLRATAQGTLNFFDQSEAA